VRRAELAPPFALFALPEITGAPSAPAVECEEADVTAAGIRGLSDLNGY